MPRFAMALTSAAMIASIAGGAQWSYTRLSPLPVANRACTLTPFTSFQGKRSHGAQGNHKQMPLDTVTVFTVDLYGTTATLGSITEADALANKRLNLAVMGNELFQFLDATQVAGFPNRWQLTNLFRGQFGTVQETPPHTGKRFVLLDGAVEFVETTADEINLLLPYRGVASGQSLGDAATFDFAWTAQSLKPLPPASISGSFDTGSGNLLIDWFDETQSVPGSDPSFELEIRNGNPGTTTLRGPLTIRPLELQRISSTPPLKIVGSGGFFLPSASYTFYPGGFDAVYTTAQWEVDHLVANVESESPFSLAGGMMIDFELSHNDTTGSALFPNFAGILPTDGGDPDIAGWVKAATTNPNEVQPRQAPFPDYVFTNTVNARFALQIEPDGTVNYFVDYKGALDQPWYTSPIKLDLTKMYRLQFSTATYDTGTSTKPYTVGVRKTRWLRNMPEFTYLDQQQRLDNSGALPSTVHVRVRKKSDHPLGPSSEWLYASFVRP